VDPTDHPPAANGWHVEEVDETASTNADLLAVAGRAPHRTVRRADHQTAGRGRLDRRWEAPPGANLLVSILFREVPDDPGELTRRVGLAVVDAALDLAGVTAGLKWPNDVVVDDRKLAGILAQRHESGAVVVGLGLNLAWAPEGAEALGADVTPRRALAAVLDRFDRLPDDVEARYRASLVTLGRRVRVELPDGELVGRAVDVERDGRLVVLDDCAVTHRVDVGDVVHLHPG
jgi:BirA family biotin operon repressor/biotin-[acetyl-CoA-carboxylase] ligase